MLGKRPPPLMKKLSELLLLGGSGRAGAPDASTSPRSPLDFKNMPPSPRYDLAGVGLGIVAALGHEAQPKHCISSHRPTAVSGAGAKVGPEDWEMESETFTYVTRHGPAGKSFTEVYYDACDQYGGVTGREANRDFHGRRRDSRTRSRCEEEEEEEALNFQTLNFLSSCHLCGKKLHGRDIYMYSGDKAFCSPECRSSQMASDERKERCKAEASKSRTTSADVSSSSNIFFSAGILAI